jgi:NADP-dependent 3-hydroxy acid dehydrogenase YdfG
LRSEHVVTLIPCEETAAESFRRRDGRLMPASGELVLYSTPEQLALEQRLVDRIMDSRDAGAGVASERAVRKTVRRRPTLTDDQRALVERALGEYGRIDVAFANAGFGGPRGFEEGDVEHWKAMVLTNVLGVAYTIRATMPALRESRGQLLITSSVAGRRALPGSLYSATKHAVTAMGEAARLDFNDTGVRVTLIEPGMVDTPFFDSPPRIEPLQADDIARAVMFAVSQPPHVDVNELLIRPTAQPT